MTTFETVELGTGALAEFDLVVGLAVFSAPPAVMFGIGIWKRFAEMPGELRVFWIDGVDVFTAGCRAVAGAACATSLLVASETEGFSSTIEGAVDSFMAPCDVACTKRRILTFETSPSGTVSSWVWKPKNRRALERFVCRA